MITRRSRIRSETQPVTRLATIPDAARAVKKRPTRTGVAWTALTRKRLSVVFWPAIISP
jgi:hypothetical protein